MRRLANTHGTDFAWFTVGRVAFNPTSDHRHVLALEYGHDVDGVPCFHSTTAALNDQHGDGHGYVFGYEEVSAFR